MAMQSMDGNLMDHHDDYVCRHLSWAIVSSAGVVSRIHFDTGGLATASMILEGEKYWVIGEPERGGRLVDSTVNFANFRDDHVSSHYRWEGISLRKGDIL